MANCPSCIPYRGEWFDLRFRGLPYFSRMACPPKSISSSFTVGYLCLRKYDMGDFPRGASYFVGGASFGRSCGSGTCFLAKSG